MEYREETISEILLDRNQDLLVTHPHMNTQSATHTDTHIIYAKRTGEIEDS